MRFGLILRGDVGGPIGGFINGRWCCSPTLSQSILKTVSRTRESLAVKATVPQQVIQHHTLSHTHMHTSLLPLPLTCVCAFSFSTFPPCHHHRPQKVTLLPALTPKWAKERYNVGTKKVSVDALEYLPQELDHLYGEIQTEKGAVEGKRRPAAFVTFQ